MAFYPKSLIFSVVAGLILMTGPIQSYANADLELWNNAKQLKERGRFAEAAAQYQKLVNQDGLAEEKKKIEQEYEEINFEWLMSRDLSPGSVYHTVIPGDNLYNIAKKYGTTVDLIKKINALTDDVIIPGIKLKIITVKPSIFIDKSDNILKLFLDQLPIKTYSVATGENNKTPTGTFKIMTKLVDPTWYKAGAVVASGSPENGLGTRWLGFDFPGYGIHGTIHPDTIGQQVSAGCIRMLNEQVEELYAIVPQGTEVIIVN